MPTEVERSAMIAYRWLQFRHWLASLIIGFPIYKAVDESYEQGRKWGNMETLRELGRNAPPAV